MKRIILTTIVTATLIYAGDAAIELEHAIKTASSTESVSEDMSEMKAMGKCGADQKSSKHSYKKGDTNASAVPVEYEHALKSSSSVESVAEDMSKMKAMGKCGADQKSSNPSSKKGNTNSSTVPIEYEHALKSSSSDEGVAEDMSKMKAMGKCGGDK